MLYTKATISNLKVKYLKMNKNKNGVNATIIIQLIKESQFFLFLNIFSLEKNSFKIWFEEGFSKFPNSSFHPYEGGSSILLRKGINLEG